MRELKCPNTLELEDIERELNSLEECQNCKELEEVIAKYNAVYRYMKNWKGEFSASELIANSIEALDKVIDPEQWEG